MEPSDDPGPPRGDLSREALFKAHVNLYRQTSRKMWHDRKEQGRCSARAFFLEDICGLLHSGRRMASKGGA